VIGRNFIDSNLRLADSWLALGAVHKNTYAVSRSRSLPSADNFQTVVIQMRTSALLLQKPTSNFSEFIVCPHLTWTGGAEIGNEQVLTFFLDKGRSIFS